MTAHIPQRFDLISLVTEAASGIGRATALTFAREGAKLVIADMNEDDGQQTVHMISENGGEATFVQVDVSTATEVEAMISKVVETYGRLDCAHNNAGVGVGCGLVCDRAYDDRGWWVRGTIATIQRFLTALETLAKCGGKFLVALDLNASICDGIRQWETTKYHQNSR